MELNKFKIIAYATLVRAGKYILDEKDREFDFQLIVPEDYKIAVADYLIDHN